MKNLNTISLQERRQGKPCAKELTPKWLKSQMCESFIFIFNKRIRLWMTQTIAIWIPSVIILHFFFSLCSVWEDTSKTDSSTACCKKKRERGSPLHMCAHSKTAVSLPNPPCLVPSELCSFLLHVRLFMAPTAVSDKKSLGAGYTSSRSIGKILKFLIFFSEHILSLWPGAKLLHIK